jgi:ABC-2 type transport system ATP-binding protein
LTPLEHLLFFARLSGLSPRAGRERAEKWMGRLGLERVAARPSGQLSLGNRQRLLIAQALMGEPGLLFLDEPTQGLDPLGIQDLRGLLGELTDRGTAVFLNSHQLAEVEKVCHRIGILHEGRLVREDTLDGLLAEGGMEEYFIEVVKGD